VQQKKLIQRLQERIAQLEQENTAFQTGIANLGQRPLVGNSKRSLVPQEQEQAAQQLIAELAKANEADLDPRLDNFLSNVLQAASQLIAFIIKWWKTLDKGAIAAQQRVAELATLNEALQAEILLRQQTEVALRTSDRRFCHTFEQAAVGMVIANLSGQWLQVNQRFCDLVGYSESELLALTFADITHPDNLAADHAGVQHLIDGELPFYQTEKRYIRKDGSLIWADLTLSLVHDAADNPAYFIGLMQDISQRKEAELVAQGQQAALQSTLAELATEPELDKFLGQVLSTIVEQLHVPVAYLWLHEESEITNLHLVQWNTQLVPDPPPTSFPIVIPLSAFRQNECWDSLNRHQPFIYSDLPNHPDVAVYRTWSAAPEGVKTLLLVPLMFGGDFVGVFSISHFQSHIYSPEALQLVIALAQQVVLAIQLTCLAEDAKQVALMEEHNRLAREIHDTLAQTFTAISLQLNNAQYYATQDAAIAWEIVEQVKTLARTGLAEARRSVWALHPDADEYRDLAGSLQRSLTQLTQHTPLQADLVIVGTPQLVPPDIGMNLLRIAQEATTNTLRHAQAQTLQIEITFKVDALELRIQDNGMGFDRQLANNDGGFGLLGMQQRCDRLSGQFTIQSQPGQGTCTLIQIPLTPPLI
jgi:two-component system, NarL family, sensor kinase